MQKLLSTLTFSLFAIAGLFAEPVILTPEADTYVQGGTDPAGNFNYPTGVQVPRLIVRSISDIAVRARYSYIRWNLSNVSNLSPGAELSLTSINSSDWDGEKIRVYGLKDVAGLTPQLWEESELTYNSAGNELNKPAVLNAESLNPTDLEFLGYLPAGTGFGTATFSSSALDAFLASRLGGRATIILAGRHNDNTEIIFASRESGSDGPALSISADVVEEPPAVYFISPDGDDANPGTLEAPWASLSHANSQVQPGDTVYIRGGTYLMPADKIDRVDNNLFARVIYFSLSGTEEKPIRYWAYEDEEPVFDFSEVKPPRRRVYAFAIFADWLHFKGITVTGVQVTITTHTQSICFESNGNNNILEQLVMHGNQAIGIYSTNGSNNLYLNCDAYNNWDYTSQGGTGGNVDGFGSHGGEGDTGNVFYGCRAWFNSDDGFDLINAHETVRIVNCWSFYNGYGTSFEPLGDGTGFKAGGYGSTPSSNINPPYARHSVQGSLAVRNRVSGFYANHHVGGLDWANNSAYRNGKNYDMLNRLSNNVTDVLGFDHFMIYNVGHQSQSGSEVSNIDPEACTLVGNAFGGLSNADFQSLDEAELMLPRKANGDLPDINFMRPVPGSAIEKIGYTGNQTIDLGQDNWVNLKGWLGWINLKHSPWIYAQSLNKYIYLLDESTTVNGGWVFILEP